MARSKTRKWNWKFVRKLGSRILPLLLRTLPSGIGFAVMGFLFLGVRQMLHADPYFQVERITVFPSSVLTASEYQYLERYAAGQSLLEIDLRAISQNLEHNPFVKRAEVVRQLPNQIQVFLTVRQPFVQVQMRPDGPYYLMAEDQMILSIHDSPWPNLITLEDFSAEKRTYAVGALFHNRYFGSLSYMFEAIKSDSILQAENISRISMDQLGQMTLILKDGIELKIGTDLSLSGANRIVLASLLKSEDRTQILYVDLRYQNLIVKKRSQAANGKTR